MDKEIYYQILSCRGLKLEKKYYHPIRGWENEKAFRLCKILIERMFELDIH